MVEKLALLQYKMDTLTASRGADQDFDLSPGAHQDGSGTH